jgi:putative ABC transport system permease protein
MGAERWLTRLRLRWRSLVGGRALDRELDDELAFHIERQIEQSIARGMTHEEARTAALRSMGGVEQRKEQMRDERRVAVVENVLRDLRMAVRQLAKQPGFALAAILSLALGIGANTAIFQLINAVSLRALPVRAPQELVEVRLTGEGRAGRHTGRNRQVSLPQYESLRQRQQAFSSALAFGDTRFNLATRSEVRYVEGLWVSGSFFETLGVQPLVGRLISPADDRAGCGDSVAVISYPLWQSEFGGRPDIVGQTVPGANAPVSIIGVTPPNFFGVEVGRQFSVAMPICSANATRSDHWWLAMLGRLKPGWTRQQAQAQIHSVLEDVQRETVPEYRAEWAAKYLKMGVDVVDASAGVSPLRRSYERPLGILMAITALVLLIASVNLANLLLARATSRSQEFAVRLALGGSRARVLQQVLTESLLLAVMGSVAAVFVAWFVSQSIPPLISTAIDPVRLDLSIDWRLFGFTALVGVTTAAIFGAAPAVHAARSSLLRGSGRSAAANDGLRLRKLLVATQVAVTLVLLFGGLLFLRTFRNLATQDTGVHQRGVLVANLFFSEREYPVEKRLAAFRLFDERLRSLPGVISMADAYTTPLGGSFSDTAIEVDGKPKGESNRNRVGPGYFATLGTPMLAGRDFDDRDGPGSVRVAIVNEAFARHFFAGDAMNRRFTVPDERGGQGEELEVVGVVATQKYQDIRESDPRIFFVPSNQDEPRTIRRYVIRSTEPPAQMIGAVTAAVAALDPNVTLRYSTLDDQLRDSMLQERLMARVAAIFGGVALLLAVVGLYGVVSYSVASRLPEIGVRVALGASRARILTLVLGDVGRMLVAGVVVGSGLALVAARGVGSLLYGLEPDDPLTLAIAAGILTMAGLLSAAFPARRAAGVDPVRALRES